MKFIRRQSNLNFQLLCVIPILLGLIAFLMTVGLHTLNPVNISWLSGWDPQQEYFGWAIFRDGPWEFPLGLNTNFGMEFGSSIVYSDSIPVVAIVFKSLNYLLPDQFQYFGIWNLISFVLQSLFAWLLLRIFIENKSIAMIAIGLFLFSPPFLWKIGSSNSLLSQFLILAGLYLVFSESKAKHFYKWIILLVLAEGIHFYIFAMVFALWAADFLQQVFIRKELDGRTAIIKLIALMIFLALMGWQFGYFAVGAGSAATGNYGIGAMNVLAPLNSSTWSYFIPSIPQRPVNFAQSNIILSSVEGMNYLGAGSILSLIFCLVGVIKNKRLSFIWVKKYPFVVLSLLFLSLLAISNRISIGPLNLYFPLPEQIINLASMFRASGRMFWPVYYMIVVGSLVVIARSFKAATAFWLILVCVVLQIWDTSSQWLPQRNALYNSSIEQGKVVLTDPFWKLAGQKYSAIIRVPAKNNLYDWTIFSSYASRNKMATNSVFLARFDEKKLSRMNEELDHEIASGKYRPDSLYILEDGDVIPVLRSLDQSMHLFARINGYNVLAPGWNACKECLGGERFNDYSGLFAGLKGVKAFRFSDQDGDRLALTLLTRGWGSPEPWGVWSNASSSRITLPVEPGARKSLSLELRALISKNAPLQAVEVSINGLPQGVYSLRQGDKNVIEIKPPAELKEAEFLVLDFKLPNAARPVDLGLTLDDERLLAIGIVSATWH